MAPASGSTMEDHDDVSTLEKELVVSSDNDSDTRNVSEQPAHSERDSRHSAASSRPTSISHHHNQAFIEPFPEEGAIALQEEATQEGEEKGQAEEEAAGDPVSTKDSEEVNASEVPLPDGNMDMRDSLVSGGSLEEGDESTITLRSRSSSSGTFSSSDGSAQVDWDELEKEEVEAPRDEGSDEV